MRKALFIMLSGIFCALTQPMSAQIIAPDSLVSDTLISIANDTLVSDSMPEWYVAPEIPLFLRAPKHTAAAKCMLDSIMTFDIDSVLVECTCYEYDNAGRTINQEVWTYNPDGSRIGKSKNEYCYSSSGDQTCTAVYTWDNTANTWKGTERFEYVYKSFSGQKKLISSTSLIWINGAWVADKRYTYNYDAAVREIEYFEYRRNTTTNELEPYKGRVQTWIDDTLKSLEEQYTTYSNGAWNAGTKKEWAYDEEGRQTLYTYYGTITNGNWVGSSKETWEYGGPEGQQTKYEKFGWYNNDWSITKRDISGFDADGRQILVENYTGANGVITGVKKEEYTFDVNGIKTMTVAYAWSNGDWIGALKETWLYGGPSGQLTLHEQFAWSTDWSKTLKEETEYSGANIVRIENYTYANGVTTGTKKEITTYTSGKKTAFTTYAWLSGAWVGSTNETWTYGGPSGQLTLHEQSEWADNDWSKTLKEETQYSGANIVRIENYTYSNGVTTGTQKETYSYTNGKKTEAIIYAWENNAWIGSTREVWAYNTSKLQTLHEKYEWANDNWTIMVQENTTYSGSNVSSIENYERIEGVWTGTQKEEYGYTSGKKTSSIVYAWTNSAWVESSKEVWSFTSSKQTLYETYAWNGSWVMTLQENTVYEGNNITKIENYSLLENVWTGTQKEEYVYSSGKKTQVVTYKWKEGGWIEYSKEIWAFNTSGNQTLHELYGWGGDWIIVLQENTTYEGSHITLIENYALIDGIWTGTQKEEYTYTGEEKTRTIASVWAENDWVFSTKNEAGYQEGNTKVSEANYTWTNNTWVGSGTLTYTIYDNDKVTQVLTKDWPTGATEWTNKTRILHTYNEDGVKILTENSKWVNGNWQMVSMTRTDIIIDGEGRTLLNAEWKCTSNGVWKGVQKDTTAYADNGNILYSARFTSWDTTNKKWIPGNNSYESKYEYDTEGRPLLNQRYEWKNNKWQGRYKYEYEYDVQGRTTMYAYYDGWSTSYSNWIGSTKKEYSYHSDTQYNQQTIYEWKNNQWVPMFSYSYSYDELDREVGQVIQTYVATDWINTNLYVKEYAGNKLVKSNEYVWINNQWTFKSRSEQYYDNDASAKLRREITGSWNNGVLSSFADNHHAYSCDPCIIRFVNYDGTELESLTMDKGLTPSYTGETPTRPEDAEYTYTFLAWTPAIVPVTGNATYTATFKATKRSYTITWFNDNDTQIDQTTVEYGVMPTHADATKTNTAEYTYTFTGWTPGIGIVTGDASYKATFSATKNKYLVVFQDEGGIELQSGEVEYGTTPEFTGTEPSKETTAQYTYSFSGWDPEITAVEGAQTYTAKYSSTVNKYTIKWLNEDDTELQIGEVEYGTTPTYDGETPHKDADEQYTYTFAGWDNEVVAVTGEATYKATYSNTTNQYTVKFVNYNGDELQSSSWNYGATPSYSGEAPTKPADDENHYAFAGWSPVVSVVTKDATYTATYTKAANEYTISWFNDDNTLIDQTTVAYGVVPTHDDPTKENTAEFTYTFVGWDHDPVAVTGAASYKATYTKTKNKYTITWLNEDGDEIEHETLEYGVTPEHTAPTKENTAEWTYTFAGWTPAIVDVVSDASYKATFSATKNSYTIKFINYNGEVLQSTNVEYGVKPEYKGSVPVKPEDDEYHYAFAGWDKEIVEVGGEETYTATFSTTTNEYTISWFNDDNTLIDQTTVAYGVVPTHEDPTKENTAEFTYTFSGWDHDPVAVTGNSSYTAVFTATKNSYTITWLNEDGDEIEHETLEYGKTPEHAAPTKENTAEWTYTFTGWEPAIVDVVSDASYKAVFNATKNSYIIKFVNYNGEVLQSTNVEYGVKPEYKGSVPVKPEDDEFRYAFAGWDKEIVEVAGEETYTATFSTTTNEYTISWFNDDNTLIDQTTVAYGVVPTHEDPTKENTAEFTYTFSGWDHDPVAVTGNSSYTAVFTATKNSYTITWLNEDGDEIEHETLEYGKTPEHAAPTKENTAEWTYTFTGWDPAIESVKGDASYKATFSATKNSYTITWLNEDGSEIEHETLEYGVTPSHADIYKESTEEFTYTFIGWTPSIVPVNGDAAYKAVFEATPVDPSSKTFTITFLHDDGITILEQVTVEYGEIPVCRYTPTKMGDAEHYYTFVGWSPEIVPATCNASYTPLFELVARQYVITFKNYDGKVLQTTKVDYGAIPEYTGATPTRNGTTQYAYVFTGWTPELAPVTKEATYKATFERTARIYTVIYYDEDGETELDRVEVAYGQMPHTSVVPTKEEDEEYYYVFIGWTPYVTFVTKDASYSALFQKKNKLEGIEDVESEEQAVKIFKNNILYILRAGKIYTVDGKLVEEY